MKHEHRLGWHESFLPLGPALREPVITISHGDMDAHAFEAGNFDIPEQAVAPTPAAPVHPSGVAPFKVGDRVKVDYSIEGRIVAAGLGVCGTVFAIEGDRGGIAYCHADAMQLLPAPREQVAEPLVRQPDSDGWIQWDFTNGLPPLLSLAASIEVLDVSGNNLGRRQVMHQLVGHGSNCRAYRVVS